ncbi:hypothetical protein [Pseudomonas fluorescens]|uniref:hypothetical protein n=1 Tax=Pseudomonas fluorescens TaxID=294 RepID=UPI001240900D|nr:hypothetical protein [Pseudomonas fluorescens]
MKDRHIILGNHKFSEPQIGEAITLVLLLIFTNFACSGDLPISCVKRENPRLMDSTRPLPPNSHLIDFINNCGKCIDLTTAPKKNGSYTDLGMTWEQVPDGEKRTGRYMVDGPGVFSLEVTNVKDSTCNQ